MPERRDDAPASGEMDERTQPLPGRAALVAGAWEEEAGDHSGFGPAPSLDAPRPDAHPEEPTAPRRVERPAEPQGFAHPQPAASAAHFVLLDAPQLDWEAFARRLQDEWGGEPRDAADGPRRELVVDGRPVTVELLDTPYRPSEIEASARGNRTWREGPSAVLAQVAQLKVSTDGIGDPLPAHAALTRAAAAAAGDSHAVAVYVPGANRVTDPASYIDTAARLRTGHLPTPSWVTVVATKAEGEGSRGWTRGLAELGHAELEVMRSARPVPELYSALGQLADYVLAHGPLYPGDTLAGPDGETLSIVAGESVLYDEMTLKIAL